MRKFWLSGAVDINSLKMETKEETVEYDSGGGGGIVNDAFADDEFDMTYTRWKDLGVIKELEENITGVKTKNFDIKKNVESQDSGHDSCSKHYSVTDSEDTATDTASATVTATDTYSELEADPMRRPNRSVSRLNMIQKLSDEQGKLGTMCQEDKCPYNQWLYRGHKFPEDKVVKQWEMKDKEKAENLPLENFCLPRVILSKQSQTRKSSPSSLSDKSHRSSSSFHYSKSPYPFAFPNPTTNIYLPSFNPPHSSGPPTPSTAPLPPYPWHLYNTPSNLSISSSYPIVTLPRSVRKSSKMSTTRSRASSQSYFSKLCGDKKSKPKTTPAPIFYMKPKNSVPPSPSLTSSCSCTSSTCSSCNSSCIDIPMDHRDPYGLTSRRAAPRKRNPCLPRCDVTCYVITFFISVSLAGLGALLFYLYMFTNMGHKEDIV